VEGKYEVYCWYSGVGYGGSVDYRWINGRVVEKINNK
jgi:hypothetical protein